MKNLIQRYSPEPGFNFHFRERHELVREHRIMVNELLY